MQVINLQMTAHPLKNTIISSNALKSPICQAGPLMVFTAQLVKETDGGLIILSLSMAAKFA